jgi:hypothetical protein
VLCDVVLWLWQVPSGNKERREKKATEVGSDVHLPSAAAAAPNPNKKQ